MFFFFFFFFLTTIILCFILSIQAISDLSTDEHPRYNIVFREQSLADVNDNSFNNKQVMMTFSNSKFTCLLPNETKERKQEKRTVQEYIKLLEPFQGCVYYKHHYWMYEYCHNKHVRQFHIENIKGEIKETASYLLGVYDNNDDDKDAIKLNENSDKLSQTWGKGTLCDITGQPRQVEIIYECIKNNNKMNDDKDHFISFHEVHTCQYQIVVATPRLCVHPSQAHDIECFPHL